jgi:HEAT repeat protein
MPVVQHIRFVTLVLVVLFARNSASSLPNISPQQNQTNQRYSREIEAEVARWSEQLKSAGQEDRLEAALNLGHIEGSAATSSLASALTDPSALVRAVALAGLANRPDTSVAPLIAARLTSDKDAFVRKTAAYALSRFSGTDRTAALSAALKDKDLEVRGAAAVSLGDHPDAAAVAPLIAALSDKTAFVRAQAARALGLNTGAAAQVTPRLIKLLMSDNDGDVRRHAATALGLIGDRSALPALQTASHSGDSYLAQAARDAIKMIERK